MLDGNKIQPLKRVMLQVIGCSYHKKEARYQIGYYQEDNIVVIKCLECPPGNEVVRFKLAKEETH